MIDEIYPTKFARKLGESVGLVEKHKKKMDHKRYVRTSEMMQSFQQMSITCDFDLALTAWYGIELCEDHKVALRAIYEHTKPFALGNAASVVQQRINSATSTSKEVNDLTNTLREMTGNKSEENEQGNGNQTASFNVFMAKTE